MWNYSSVRMIYYEWTRLYIILFQANKELEQKLEKANEDNSRLAGHQNLRQKIQYISDIKKDYQALKEVGTNNSVYLHNIYMRTYCSYTCLPLPRRPSNAPQPEMKCLHFLLNVKFNCVLTFFFVEIIVSTLLLILQYYHNLLVFKNFPS